MDFLRFLDFVQLVYSLYLHWDVTLTHSHLKLTFLRLWHVLCDVCTLPGYNLMLNEDIQAHSHTRTHTPGGTHNKHQSTQIHKACFGVPCVCLKVCHKNTKITQSISQIHQAASVNWATWWFCDLILKRVSPWRVVLFFFFFWGFLGFIKLK